MRHKETTLMDCGYFYCPNITLFETPIVFQDLTGRDLTNRYEEYNRLVEQATVEVIVKEIEQIQNWKKEGF